MNANVKNQKEITNNQPDLLETRTANNKTELAQILKELRGHYGKLSEVIMELVDNASSAFEKFGFKGHIDIYIYQNGDGTLRVIVRDNGHGIQNIDAALALGKRSVALTALSGHGMGFKNLPVESITMRTVNQNGEAYIVHGPFVERVKISRVAGFVDLERGTEFDFVIKEEYLYADIARWGERSNAAGSKYSFNMLCEYLAEHIAVVMGRRIAKLGHTITVHLDGVNVKKKDIEVEPLLLNINPCLLRAKEPSLGVTSGVATIDAFDGFGKIRAEYEFGYGAPSRKSRRGYFDNNQISQGWYISINNRYIGKTETICLRKTHPCLNGLMGWVNLVVDYAEQAPQTEIAKTGFVEASIQYTKLLEAIAQLIPSLNEVITREVAKACIHDIIRDELHGHLLHNLKHNVGAEVKVPGESEQEIDVLDYTSRTLYEIKPKAAATKDVWQVFGYVSAYLHNTPMNVPFDTICICATDFPEPFMATLADANAMLSRDGLEIQCRYLHELEGVKTLPTAKK